METIDQAMLRLANKGYVTACRVAAGGLRFIDSQDVQAFAGIEVDETVRIEGTSSPEEESVIFAMHGADSDVKGTYCVAFGGQMEPDDVDAVLQLPVGAPTHH